MNRFVAGDSGNDLRSAGPSVTLIAVNCIPLLGAILWGWTLFEVVVLYWFENVVIGAINVLKMVTCAPDEQHLTVAQGPIEESVRAGATASGAHPPAAAENDSDPPAVSGLETSAAGHHLAKLFLIPFFSVHYGMFCFVHGIFVIVLLAGGDGLAPSGPFSLMGNMVGELLTGGLLIAAAGLSASHLYSFFFHFLGRGEFRRTNVGLLMFAPYGRIVVLHLAILFGAFAIVFLGQPMALVVLLIIGKTVLDWLLHVRAHRNAETSPLSDQNILWHQQSGDRSN